MPATTTNRLTARALTLALHGAGIEEAAVVLAQLAGGNRLAVAHALARVRRGLLTQPSPIGERAADSLLRVLHDAAFLPAPVVRPPCGELAR